MGTEKQYLSSQDVKELLYREIRKTVLERLKGDFLGLGIVGVVFLFFGVITYFLVETLKLNISAIEFLILYTTFISTYIGLGYLFMVVAEQGRIVHEHDPYSFYQKLTNWMAAVGIIFFPANVVISLLKDLTIAFRYSESELILIGKIIVYLRNHYREKGKISYFELKNILEENVSDIRFNEQSFRKAVNFLYKNGLIKIERRKEKVDPEGRHLFFEFDEAVYKELFDFLLRQEKTDRTKVEKEENLADEN